MTIVFRTTLKKIVNEHLENVMMRFRSDFPNLKERDYKLFLYVLLNFSPRAISIFQGITTDAVYNRKYVLKRKITSSSSENAQEYLSYMG